MRRLRAGSGNASGYAKEAYPARSLLCNRWPDYRGAM